MRRFVHYTPDVERDDPGFAEALATVIENTKRYIRRSVETDGSRRAVRDTHAKGYGLVRGELEVLGDLPEGYAQGIYSRPGRHEALIRFSNGASHTGPDRYLPAVCGIGLKIFGVEGRALLEDEPHSGTFDYTMINNPTFFVSTIQHYTYIQELVMRIGAARPVDESPAQQRLRVNRFLHEWVTGQGRLPPDEWLWEELAAFLSLSQIESVNLLLSTYWTMGAARHGAYIAKLRLAPVAEFADCVGLRTLDHGSGTEVFRPALVAELSQGPYAFDLQVQLCTDTVHMPVEDLTVPWPEALSPFVTVARLWLPRQDIGGDDNLERMDATSMTPWRCIEEHRPLGNLQRARKEIYRQSSILRHELNGQVRREPRDLAEVFGG